MYDSEQEDLVVKYYDRAFGVGSQHERRWYLDRVKAQGGPVLDLACGTGRLALDIAALGLSVTGIDQSESMLAQFRTKLRAKPAELQQLVQIASHPMNNFKLDAQFNVVICCDAFFHNLSVASEIACLNCVYPLTALSGPESVFVSSHPMQKQARRRQSTRAW